MMVRNNVDLPTPLRPSTARLPFSGSSNATLSSTTESPYPARTSRMASSGSAMVALPQIDVPHPLVGRYLRRGAFHQDRARHHYDDAGGETKHQLHVVLDK